MPRFQPLAVGQHPAPFNHRDYFFEIKWDGFRCLTRIEHGKCELVSRNDNEFKSFSSLNVAVAQELKNRSVVLDGEIVCLDNAGKPQFYDLLFKRREPRLCAFDLLWLDGEDLRYAPLAERKATLRGPLREPDRLFYCDHVEQYGEALFELSCQKDLEGIVAKRKYDPYLPGTRWLKIRNQNYSHWVGRHELFERYREGDPDMHCWDSCASVCEEQYDDL